MSEQVNERGKETCCCFSIAIGVSKGVLGRASVQAIEWIGFEIEGDLWLLLRSLLGMNARFDG